MSVFVANTVGPVLVAVSLAAAAISTAKWWLDLRQERAAGAQARRLNGSAKSHIAEDDVPDPPEAA